MRARTIVEELVKLGISSSRLSSCGLGGTNPVAKRTDYNNWWKNHRVELVFNSEI
jgi:outer membrane protein OmpA-like peptidoglycan-associated protein